MKVMDTILPLHGEPPCIVGSGVQALLDRLADSDVFQLDLIAECDRLGLDRRTRISEPLEDRQGFIRAEGHNNVAAQIVWVDVEQKIRKNPIIEGTGSVGIIRIPAILLPCSPRPDGRILRRVVTMRVGAIMRIVEFPKQPRMSSG